MLVWARKTVRSLKSVTVVAVPNMTGLRGHDQNVPVSPATSVPLYVGPYKSVL